MPKAILQIFALCLVFSACDVSSSVGDKQTAEKNGLSGIAIVKDFDDVFPGAFHWIGYYTGTKGDPRWNSEVGVHGRYVISMKFGIEFDSTRTMPTRTGVPKFFLREVATIDTRPGGGASIGYTQNQITFGIDEWNRLRDSGGDLSMLGFEVIEDRPIADFAQALQNR